MINQGMMSSNKDDWETPRAFFDELNREFHFTLDAAASDTNHKVDNYFTKETDALTSDWGGEVVFCNPPYGREVPKWVEKAYKESLKPNTTVVLLVASRTDTRWFHDYILGKAEIRFIKGRLKFEVNGIPKDPAPFPSLLAIYR